MHVQKVKNCSKNHKIYSQSLSNSATASHQITQLVNNDILILNF